MSPSAIRLQGPAVLGVLVAALLTGRVVDKTTGQPLPNVRITGGGASAATDSAGRYHLRVTHAGTYTLTLQSADVPVARVRVRLRAGANERDLRACSTTLDYGCGGAPPGAGAG